MFKHTAMLVFLYLLSTATYVSAITALAPRATTTCAADNCLRALSNAYTSTASAFCATYTTQATAKIPAYATSGCANNPSRVSSACTCLATSYGQPKPFRRVYGGTNGINGTSYMLYYESLNIRSDDFASGTYDQYLKNCQIMCEYYGNGCQTFSYVMTNQFYLCYIYAGTFDPAKVTNEPSYRRLVVMERYQV